MLELNILNPHVSKQTLSMPSPSQFVVCGMYSTLLGFIMCTGCRMYWWSDTCWHVACV